MRQTDLDILLHEGEGAMLEYKESFSSSLAWEFVAFANRPGTAQVPRKHRTTRIEVTPQIPLKYPQVPRKCPRASSRVFLGSSAALEKERELKGPKEGDMKARKKVLSQETLQEIIRRIVKVAKPEKIILFGSAVRGEMGPNSDLDLVVIEGAIYIA